LKLMILKLLLKLFPTLKKCGIQWWVREQTARL
jgi:hypothetical protein